MVGEDLTRYGNTTVAGRRANSATDHRLPTTDDQAGFFPLIISWILSAVPGEKTRMTR